MSNELQRHGNAQNPDKTTICQVGAWLDLPDSLIDALLDTVDQIACCENAGQCFTQIMECIALEQQGITQTTSPWARCHTLGSEIKHLLPLVALVSMVPAASALHQSRGIPEQVSQETFDDQLRWAHDFHRRQGRWGIDECEWLLHGVAGRLVRLGRLQFEVSRNRWDIPGIDQNHSVLLVHIPAMGKLAPSRCDESFESARSKMPRYFPEHKFLGFVCDAWLLDPQLKAYLPAGSNIIQFQERFELLEGSLYPSNDIERRNDHASSPTSKLSKAIKKHRTLGKDWCCGIGHIPF